MNEPILIVAALNGTRRRDECPNVPLTAAELATEAKRAVSAGAAIVHVHARKADGSPAYDLSYDDILAGIRAEVDVPVSITTQRTRQTSLGTITALFDVLREVPDLASVNVRPPEPDLPAHREEARQILEACERAGVRPEPTVLSVDSLADLETLYNDSLLARMPYLVLEFGPSLGGASERLSGSPRNVLRLVDAVHAQFSRFPWVAAGQDEMSPVVCAVAAAAGGHVRVGFEDAATLPDGSMASSNAQLVEFAVSLADTLGRPVMEPAEARALFR